MATTPESLPLRDIHLPDAVSWWPPAPGWWLLLLVVLALIIVAIYMYQRRRNRLDSAVHLAQCELQAIRDRFTEQRDQRQLLRDLSALLRRSAVSLHERQDVASLTGEAWLEFLDTHMADKPFTRGPGRALESGPYQPETRVEPDALLQICDDWLQQTAGRVTA
ncbi:MAG: DUF4381 domain-containing protein [Proteobacteria bacterium]|nr:DUF4381 domain-containing protein [Pseudomonadota bacterium]